MPIVIASPTRSRRCLCCDCKIAKNKIKFLLISNFKITQCRQSVAQNEKEKILILVSHITTITDKVAVAVAAVCIAFCFSSHVISVCESQHVALLLLFLANFYRMTFVNNNLSATCWASQLLIIMWNLLINFKTKNSLFTNWNDS